MSCRKINLSSIYLSSSHLSIYLSMQINNSPVGWGCRIRRLHLFRWARNPSPKSVLDMALNCIWRWGLSFGAFRNMKYHFSDITLNSTLSEMVKPITVLTLGFSIYMRPMCLLITLRKIMCCFLFQIWN